MTGNVRGYTEKRGYTNISHVCGKVICEKQIRMSDMHNVLQQTWGRYSGLRVKKITGDVILFEFENEED